MKQLLKETYTRTKRMTGIDPRTPQGIRHIITDPNAFSVYAKSLSEGLTPQDTEDFMLMAESTRVALMENSMFQLNPYETLTMPVLRVFYPRLIARELVNVMPIDKPDVIKGFIHAYFKKNGESTFGHEFPSTSTDISRGPSVGVTVTKTATPGTTDVLAEASLTSTQSHIEHDFQITGVYDGTTGTVKAVSITLTVDGNFSETVTTNSHETDVISGHVDFENGTLTWSSANSAVTSIRYQAYCTLEENQINPTVRFEIEKIRFTTIDRRISAEWTLNMEQDVKALFDIALQSELVNIIGEQIALDIDREIINALISANSSLNPATHTKTFDLNPPTTFPYGRKGWYENIIPTLNDLSAQIYNSSLMGAANTLACNPLDAAVFESLNSFEYTGTSVDSGDVGYRSATVTGGKWKVLISSVVPQGSVIAKYRSNDLSRAAFVYAPYVPALLSPYPLGNIPSLTVMTRYSSKVIRNEALGVLTITDTE
jgi:hypothetical protein